MLRDLPEGGHGWRVSYACIARGGFTPAARQALEEQSGIGVDMEMLEGGLP